jgi:glycosyltransferase involved in cell wall biosynthesis
MSPFVVVVLPTYRRPEQVVKTLDSLASQQQAPPFAVVVVENDAQRREGFQAATHRLARGDLSGVAVVEERQGNCNAYNRGFAEAEARFPHATHVAIIDDDEIATPTWLHHLVKQALEAKVDIIGGPHRPIFEDKEGERRYGRHPVFHPPNRSSGATTGITSTGNCLIGMHVLRAMGPPHLDERYNFLGGGDTDFFTRCSERGFTFYWAAEAAVDEIVPARRTRRDWITARSIRNGLISTIIQRKQTPGFAGRVKVIAKSLALLAVSPFRSAMLALKTGSLYIGSYHILIAVGRLLAEFGYTIEQYRAPEKN